MDGVFLVIVSLLTIVIVVYLIGKYQRKGTAADADVLNDVVSRLRDNLHERCADAAKLKMENETLTWSKVNDVNRIKELNDKIYSLEKELGKLRIDLSSKKMTISRLLSEKNELNDVFEKELGDLRVELSNKKAVISGLNLEKNELNDKLKIAEDEGNNAAWEISELHEKCDDREEEIDSLNAKIDAFDKIIGAKNPFDYVAHLRAHALEHIKEYEGKKVEELAELFKYQYKFEYLLSIYPELKVYRDDDAYLQYMQEEEKRCNIKNWISDHEYENLSEVEREQLAVDRYIANYKSSWTNWEKGRNYEIYVAYMLYNDKTLCNDGYDIIQEGLNKKLEDKGRDIIATHRKTGQVLIVQCKNWSEHSVIRENVIFQLYGSYMQWLVDNGKSITDDVVPCLYHTCRLSPVAEQCAKALKVKCEMMPIGKFPAIKCNVNHNTGQKIYHLPFDRHYDLVKINAKGKGYKFKIAEAIDEGFRRAYNH